MHGCKESGLARRAHLQHHLAPAARASRCFAAAPEKNMAEDVRADDGGSRKLMAEKRQIPNFNVGKESAARPQEGRDCHGERRELSGHSNGALCHCGETSQKRVCK